MHDPAIYSRGLALLFAAHNVEEYVHLRGAQARRVSRARPQSIIEEWREPRTMAVALLLLTGLAVGLATPSRNEPGPVVDAADLVGSTAVAFNAVTHVARAVVFRQYNGGLLTAPLLFVAARAVRRSVTTRTLLSARTRRLLTGAGIAGVPLVIGSALEFSRQLNRRQSRRATPHPSTLGE